MDRRAQAQHRRGIACGGIVVRERTPDRAHVAHLAIPDAFGQRGQCRNGILHHFRRRDFGVARHRADHQVVALLADAFQLGDSGEVDERRGLREAHLHRGDETLPPGQGLPAGLREQRRSVGDRIGFVQFEVVHMISPLRACRLFACLDRLPHAMG